MHDLGANKFTNNLQSHAEIREERHMRFQGKKRVFTLVVPLLPNFCMTL
jgi:hypothetical protein